MLDDTSRDDVTERVRGHFYRDPSSWQLRGPSRPRRLGGYRARLSICKARLGRLQTTCLQRGF